MEESPVTIKKLTFDADGNDSIVLFDDDVEDVPAPKSVRKVDEPKASVQVFLRVRPPKRANSVPTLIPVNEETVRAKAPKTSRSFASRELGGDYAFDRVFCSDATQTEIYDSTLRTSVEAFKSGKNSLLFAYGVTNAGKTYTIEGTQEEPGLVPRALEHLFSPTGSRAELTVSYLQIYNQHIQDLQATRKRTSRKQAGPPERTARPARGAAAKKARSAKVRTTAAQRSQLAMREELSRPSLKLKVNDDEVLVKGLVETPVASFEDAMGVLRRGGLERRTTETALNAKSSRSHSVFCIKSDAAKLFVVDLAGSERGKRTGGVALREASHINQSLGTLTRCLDAIRRNQQSSIQRVVPFRDNKLTLLFRDCFVGPKASGVTMLVAASPENDDYDETVQVLKFGALSKSIDLVKASLAQSTAVNERRERQLRAAGEKNVFGFDGRRRVGRQSPPPPPTTTSVKEEEEKEEEEQVVVVDDIEESREQDDEDPRDAEIRSLKAAIDEMADAMGEIQSKAVRLESDIRAEVATEMTTRLEEMEASYRGREQEAARIADETVDKRVENQRKRDGAGFCSRQDAEELADQVAECEEEMERMRRSHKSEIDTLERRAAERALATRQDVVARLLGNATLSPTDEVRTVLEICFNDASASTPSAGAGFRVFQEYLTKKALQRLSVPDGDALRRQIDELNPPRPAASRVAALRSARKKNQSPGQKRFRDLVERFDSPASATAGSVAAAPSPRSPTLQALSGKSRVLRQSNRIRAIESSGAKRKSPTTHEQRRGPAKRTRASSRASGVAE